MLPSVSSSGASPASSVSNSLRIKFLRALAALTLTPAGFAASANWNVDADGLWSDAANWSTAAVPGDTSGGSSPDVATFNKALTAVRTVTVDANRVIGAMTFAQTSSFGYTLAGGPLLLANGGTIQFTNSNPSASPSQINSITAPLVAQGDGGSVTLIGNGTSGFTFLSIGGDISGVSTAGNTTTLRLAGFSATTNRITGAIGDGAAGGKVAVFKTGSGLWQFNSATSTYSGGTTVGSGQLSVGASSTPTTGTVTNGPLGTGTVTFGGGFLQAGTTNTTLANAISVPLGANTNVRGTASGNIILTGPVTGVGTFTNNHTTSASAIVQGDISGFAGTFAHNTVTGGNNFTFNGTTPESQNGSNARFLLSGTGTNRALNLGSTEAPIFQMGELTGAGGRIAPNILTGVTLKVGALNTNPTTPFSGAITGTLLALEKVGTGTLILAGANAHTGATTVSAGTLRVTGSITASPVTVASGATFGGEGTLAQPLNLSAGSTLAFDSATAGALQVNNGLAINGPVFIDLDGAAATPAIGQTARVVNYTGTLSGTPSFDVSRLRNATVSTTTANQIDVTFDTKSLVWSGQSAVWATGGAANWNGGADSFYHGDVITFDDTGANKDITLSGDLKPASVAFTNEVGYNYTLSGSGRIVGATAVTKSGGGVVTLSGTQAYSGVTTVNGGTLKVGGLSGGFAIGTGGTLEVTGANGLTGVGAVTVGAGGTLVLAANNNLTGAVNLDGTLQLRNAASIATVSALNLNNGGALQLRSDADTTFTLPAVTLASGGTATIDVAPATTVGNRNLTIGALSFTGASTNSAVNVTGADGHGLTINGLTIVNNNTVSTSITRTRFTLRANTAPVTVTGTITATSAGSRDVGIILDGTNTDSRFLSRITNAGGGWTFLDKQGSGTWTMSGTACNYSGATTIAASGGILRVENPSAISTSSTSSVQFSKNGATTGTLQLNVPGSSTFTQNMNSASSFTFGAGGTANVQNLQGNTTLSGNLTINGTGGSGMNIQSDVGGTLTLTGTLSNNVASSNRVFDLGGAGDGEVSGLIRDGTNTAAVTSLMKEGAGTWTITGVNTYTGTTTVGGGTLNVTGTGTLGSSRLALANGATLNVSGTTAPLFTAPAGLGGSGVLNATGKSVTVAGPFAPVSLSINGNVTLTGATTFVAGDSIGTTSATSVTGTLQNGGTLVITPLAFATTPVTYHTFAADQIFRFATATGGIQSGYTGVSVNVTGDPLATPLALAAESAGVWTATSEGLIYTYSETTATFTVTAAAISPLQAWRNTHFPVEGNNGTGIGALDADPDSDGLSNLLEYATGTVPTAANPSAVTVDTSAGKLTLTYNRVDDPAVSYSVEGRNDLASGTWTPVVAANNPSNGGTTAVTVVDDVAISAQPRRFLRLQVTLTP